MKNFIRNICVALLFLHASGAASFGQTTLSSFAFEDGRKPNPDDIAYRTKKPAAQVLTESNGNHFLRMYVSPEDGGQNGEAPFFTYAGTVRSELLIGNIDWKTYNPVTVSFSVRVPGVNAPTSNMLAQFYQYGANSGWVTSLSAYDGGLGVTSKDGNNFELRNTLELGPVVHDQWVAVTMSILFSAETSVGRVSVTMNGRDMGTVTGRTLKNLTDPMSFYLNLYGAPILPYASIDFDNILIRSGVTPPPPPPPVTTLTRPTGLVATCDMNLKKFTVQWNPVAGADNYFLRVDYLPNNVGTAWHIVEGVDYNLDAATASSFTGTAYAGAYSWWVHPNNASGLGSATSGTMQCADPASPPSDTQAPTPGGSGVVTITQK